MARKRGGLAGVWDRNKKIITPVAEGLLGMIPGVGVPLAAGFGAIAGGLDRPGKSGIGFDAGSAVRGGISGAGMGGVGSMVRGGAQSLMAKLGTGSGGVPTLPSVKMPDISYNASTGAIEQGGMNGKDYAFNRFLRGEQPSGAIAGSPAASRRAASQAFGELENGASSALKPPAFTPSSAGLRANAIPSGVGKQTGYSLMDRLGRGVEWAQKNDKVAELALKGISSALPNQETNALNERNRIAQRQYELEQRQYEDEQRRKQQMAQLLMPLYQQMMATGKYGTPTTTP